VCVCVCVYVCNNHTTSSVIWLGQTLDEYNAKSTGRRCVIVVPSFENIISAIREILSKTSVSTRRCQKSSGPFVIKTIKSRPEYNPHSSPYHSGVILSKITRTTDIYIYIYTYSFRQRSPLPARVVRTKNLLKYVSSVVSSSTWWRTIPCPSSTVLEWENTKWTAESTTDFR